MDSEAAQTAASAIEPNVETPGQAAGGPAPEDVNIGSSRKFCSAADEFCGSDVGD